MPSNYTVITDGPVELPRPDGDIDTDLAFDAPKINGVKRPVLFFKADPSQDAVTLTVSINGVIVRSVSLKNVNRTFHEVVAANVVKPSGNTLTLKVDDNDGVMRVADVVLLYKEQ
jgi:hypothetical protein